MQNKINLVGTKFKIEGGYKWVNPLNNKERTKLLSGKIWVDQLSKKDLGEYEDSALFERDYTLTFCGLNFNATLIDFNGGGDRTISNANFILVGKPYLESDGE